MEYIKKQAGRPFPDDYGKVDAPVDYVISLKEYMAHKDNPQECYFLIGRNLEHAQRLILTDPIQIRRSGVGIASEAALFVCSSMDDKALAAAIADLYVMPYLHLGSKLREDHLSKPNLLRAMGAYYDVSGFPDKRLLAAEETCRESIDMDGQDSCRMAMARALLKMNRVDDAIHVLEQITHPPFVKAIQTWIEEIKKKHGKTP